MTASIQVYSPEGVLMFDSSYTRVLRYAGVDNASWKFDYSEPNGQGRVYYFSGTLPKFPGWNLGKNIIIMGWQERIRINFDNFTWQFFTQGSVDVNRQVQLLNERTRNIKVYAF